MGQIYKGIVLTNHALERMRERFISPEQVFATINHPDRSRYAQEKSAFIYNKTFGNNMVEVVGSKNDRKEWVVVSVWSRPLERLKYTRSKYLYRSPIVDWILEKIVKVFKGR